MEVTVHFYYAPLLSLQEKITVNSYLINEVIDKWNSRGVAPFIYRSQCFIFESWGNIYKDTDTFFIGSQIFVIKRPPIGQPFFPNIRQYPVTRVRNDRGEEFDTNQDFSDKGDCYIVRLTRDGYLPRGYNPEMRVLNLQRIKDANALGDKLNTLGRLTNQQGAFINNDILSLISSYATGVDARVPVNESKTKRGRKEEEGPICVIT